MAQCPRCQNSLTLLQQHGIYYCQVCNQHYQMLQPAAQQPVEKGGNKAVWVVVVIVAVCLILATILIITAEPDDSSETKTTPQGSLTFISDPEMDGKYHGTFQGSVRKNDVNISAYDESQGETRYMDPPSDSTFMQVGNGLTIYYDDSNRNRKLDAPDTITLHYAEPGDEITVFYRPTGEVIATYTIS